VTRLVSAVRKRQQLTAPPCGFGTPEHQFFD